VILEIEGRRKVVLRVTYICDRCKKEDTQEKVKYYSSPTKWKEVKISLDRYNETEMLLCPDCQKALGLLKDEKPEEFKEAKSVADKLVECIAEIVAEQMQG
jgi:predicted transcriptional regulator